MKFNTLRKYFSLSVAAALTAFPNPGFASTPALEPVSISRPNQASTNSNVDAVINYWMANNGERLRRAKPVEPKAAISPQAASTTTRTTKPSVEGKGSAPTVTLPPSTQQLFTPTTQPQAVNTTGVQPNNFGTAGALFTSSRIIPLAADQAYPYVTVGKLFFTDPRTGENSVCSASVLRPRIVLTAGHCVHRGSGGSNGFYTNFVFIPAYRDGVAPYGIWTWNSVVTTGEWATSNGNFPNAADFAILEVKDQTISGRTRRIGEITGFLGYQTQRLAPNHATLLGYPVNLDFGQKMHQVTAQSFAFGGNNTVLYGSDMRGGSSGGPWVQNFGIPAVGQVDGLERGENRIIGVTSFGPVAIGPLYQGSSILNDSFIAILNRACSRRSGNC
jgi:V8-like Glu-specific endopeptidase